MSEQKITTAIVQTVVEDNTIVDLSIGTQGVTSAIVQTVVKDETTNDSTSPDSLLGFTSTFLEYTTDDQYVIPQRSGYLGFNSAYLEYAVDDQYVLPQTSGYLGINSAFSEITSTEDQISAVTKFNSAFFEIVWVEKMVNRPIKTYTGGSIYPSNFTNDNLFKTQFTGYSPSED